jgi:outer membrane protein, multidrug efflux system
MDKSGREQSSLGNQRKTMRKVASLFQAHAISSAAACVFLAGCAADFFEPTLTFPLPYRYEAAKSTKPPEVTRWWTRFGSGELNSLMDLAAAENLDIAVALARIGQAEAQSLIARAALFPTLDYAFDASRSQTSGTTEPGIIKSPTIRSSFRKALNASYAVDLWGRNRDLLNAARFTEEASIYQAEVVRLTTLAGVVNAFLQYAAAMERVSIATENLRSAERILGVIRERFAAGTASELDLAQQESLVAGIRASIPPLRLIAQTFRTALAVLLGRPPEGFALRIRRLGGIRTPTVSPGIPSELLVRRPEVRNAEALLASAHADVEAARKALLPSIQLTGQAGFQSAALSTLFRPESVIWTIAASVMQPIFEGGRLRAQIELTQAQRQELLETYRKSIVTALTDVENALNAIRENTARTDAERIAVEKARRAFELSEERLRQGTIDLITLLNTQTTLFTAEDLLVQDRLSVLQAVVSLFQALGGDWDDRVPILPSQLRE